MKKIMFNDRYGLTSKVLSGHKTQTRRIIPDIVAEEPETPSGGGDNNGGNNNPPSGELEG